MRRRTRTSLLVAASFFMVGFAGCGNKPEKVEYAGNAATESDGLEAASTGNLREYFNAGEEWAETISSSELGKRIDAAVDIPDVSGMKVIQMREKYYGEEEKREFLSKLTDGTVYKYDDVSTPKHVIEQQIAEMHEIIDAIDPDTQDEYEQMQIERCYEYIEELQNQYESAPDDWIAEDKYSSNMYAFCQDDIEYMVYFNSQNVLGIPGGGDNVLEVCPRNAADVYADCPYEQVYMMPTQKIDMVTKKNECNIAMEQAQEMAEEYLKKLDIGTFSIADTYPLFLNGRISYYEAESYTNGYVVMFYRNVDGIMVEGNRYNYAPDISTGDGGDYGMEKILVCVNDSGVIGMEYIYPYEPGEVTSKDTALLSYDIIKTVFIEEIASYEDYEHVTFEKLSLMYYPVRSDENTDEYTLVPAWRLADGEYYGEIINYIVVNAIDGSLIHTGRE